jgi:hypothetical protein
MTDSSDPLNVNARLYRQIARLLDDLEEEDVKQNLDIKERIAALIAVARIQTVFVALRKEDRGGTRGSGSAVRKYSKAFAANASRGRKATAGRTRSAAAELAADDFGDDDAS